MSPTLPSVTVAVPVKDRRERMLRCLDALLALDYPDFEILVIDNGSTDGTPEACRARAEGSGVPVRVEVVDGTVGRIRNEAGRLAAGEVIAFTDSDCIADPGWLRHGVGAFADPGVGMVCGRTEPEEAITDGWPATIEVSELTMRFESCNVLFRTAAFVASAGFDETVGHFWEDTAAGFAMLRDGWRVAFAPEAVIRHDVTYPGYRWHLARAQRNANLAVVLARYPEIRKELLWMRVFLRPRSAQLALALVGAALTPRRPAAAALAAPYLLGRFPSRPTPKELVQTVLYDCAVTTGLLRGGLRHGQIVL